MLRTYLATLVTAALLAGGANAAVIISNYAGNDGGTTSTTSSVTGLFAKGAGFTMAAGPDYQFDISDRSSRR